MLRCFLEARNLWRKVVHIGVWELDDDDPPGVDGGLQAELGHGPLPGPALGLAQERHLGGHQVGPALLYHNTLGIKLHLFYC